MRTCSWCGQEVKGPRLDFRVPGRRRVLVCRECGLGWSSLLAYGAAIVVAATHKKPSFTVGSFGALGRRPSGTRSPR